MLSEKKFLLTVVLLAAISLLCRAADDDSDVIKAQRYHKTLWGKDYSCAVVVTLKNQERWLIYKQPARGSGNGNVVIDSNIQKEYKLVATKNVTEATVIDYIRAAGKKYNFRKNNFSHACDSMMAID